MSCVSILLEKDQMMLTSLQYMYVTISRSHTLTASLFLLFKCSLTDRRICWHWCSVRAMNTPRFLSLAQLGHTVLKPSQLGGIHFITFLLPKYVNKHFVPTTNTSTGITRTLVRYQSILLWTRPYITYFVEKECVTLVISLVLLQWKQLWFR